MLLTHLHSFRLPEWVTNDKVSWCVGIPVKDLGSIFLNGACCIIYMLCVLHFDFVEFRHQVCYRWLSFKLWKSILLMSTRLFLQHWTLYKIWHGPLMPRTLILKFPFVLQNSLILLIFYLCSCISIAFILTWHCSRHCSLGFWSQLTDLMIWPFLFMWLLVISLVQWCRMHIYIYIYILIQCTTYVHTPKHHYKRIIILYNL